MKKTGKAKMTRFLEQNQAPDPMPEKIVRLKQEIRHQAEVLPCVLPPEASLPDRLLRQIPYISLWIWPVQLLLLLLFATFLRKEAITVEQLLLLSFTGPLLAVLPVADIVRSFGCNMWEMEAACRYDLRQITAMRLCIIGGGDIVVLAVGGCLYGRHPGGIGEFSLYILLPFLASSCLYLWELNHFSRKCNGYLLAATGIVLNFICFPVSQHIYSQIHVGNLQWFLQLIPGIVIVLSAVALYGAVNLCGKQALSLR